MPLRPDLPAIITRDVLLKDAETVRLGHAATYAEHKVREPGFGEQAPFIEPYLTARPRLARLFPWLIRQRRWLWVAERGGVLVGHLAARRMTAPGWAWVLVVEDLTVYEGFRGTGVGRALVTRAQLHARKNGATRTLATIWPGNAPSIAFFKALGYTLVPRDGPRPGVTLILAAEPKP